MADSVCLIRCCERFPIVYVLGGRGLHSGCYAIVNPVIRRIH